MRLGLTRIAVSVLNSKVLCILLFVVEQTLARCKSKPPNLKNRGLLCKTSAEVSTTSNLADYLIVRVTNAYHLMREAMKHTLQEHNPLDDPYTQP